MTMFMVLSSLHSHCESSPNPQIKPIGLGCESADRLLSSADTIAIYYYYSARKLILILPSHRGWKAESMCQC